MKVRSEEKSVTNSGKLSDIVITITASKVVHTLHDEV